MSASIDDLMRRWLLPTAAALFAASIPVTGHAEEGGDPDGGGTLTEEEQRLEDWAEQKELLRQGREAAAEFHYDQGVRSLEAGRTDDAIRHLRTAVDYFPGNEKYVKALNEAQTFAGLDRDPRSTYIDRVAAEIDVEHQRLWIEIQQRIEEGLRHLERGEYNQAELKFELARVRLENLPYADERREPEMRRVEILLSQTKERRRAQELQDQARANDLANVRQKELRRYQLKLERDRIDAMLQRALKARDRRDYDEAILLAEQVLRINRAEPRAHSLLVRARRERHSYLRKITADKWDEEHKLLSEQIRRDMLPQMDLVEYSEDWHVIDARRSAPVRGLDAEGQAWRQDIERKLDSTTLTLDFPDLDITDVITWLQRNTDVNFVLDPEVTAQNTPPVAITLANVKLRNALEFIARQTQLRYTLQDEAVYFSTEQGLRGDAYMKVYDIRDLTVGLTQFPGPSLRIPEPGETGAQLLAEVPDEAPPDADEFLDIITQVVEPESWLDAAGAGVGIDIWNGALVVTQTASVHDQIEELLRTLRNQQAVQINVKVRFLSVENTLLEEIGFDWNDFTGPPGWPAPLNAGANPNTPTVTPPWWLGGYGRTNDGQHIGGAQVTNELLDFFSESELQNTGGFTGELQIYEDPEGWLSRTVLRAVEKTRRGNVLIAPDLTLMSGQRSHLVHMTQQSYVADFDVEGDQYNPVTSILSFGTVLDVSAIASADKKWITLTLRPTTTDVSAWRRFGADVEDFGGVAVENTDADGNNLSAIADQFPLMVPQLQFRSVQTSVTIPDGGSLLIAGMTLGSSARSHSGIPFLSHIPFLGRLFSKNGRSEREFKDLVYVEGNIILFQEIEENL